MNNIKKVTLIALFFTRSNIFAQPVIEIHPLPKFNLKALNYHKYDDHKTFICTADNKKCTVDNVYQEYLSDSRYLAPTYGQQPVSDGGELYVTISIPGINFPGLHPIRIVFGRLQHMVTNYTLPLHILHPGQVERRIIQEGNGIYLTTVGEGEISIDKFFSAYVGDCGAAWFTANGITAAERLKFGEPLGKLAKWLNERKCIVNDIWDPVDIRFVEHMKEFIKSSPDKSKIESTVFNDEFIWKSAFPNNEVENGKIITGDKNNTSQQTEVHETYDFLSKGLENTVVLFYTYMYFQGSKSNCHACYPKMSLARFIHKNNKWSLEKFSENFEGTTGAWGDGPRLSFIILNGLPYMKTVINEMADPKDAEVHFYNLETFKEETIH